MTIITNDLEPSPLNDVLGPLIRFTTPLTQDEGYCLLQSVVPANVVVPLHSHADRETMYILEGQLECFLDTSWQSCGPGDVIDIPPNVRHAFRNASGRGVKMLLITTMEMGRFFGEIATPAIAGQPSPPTPQRLQQFVSAAQRYGYWLGSPKDNESIGLALAA